MALLVAACSRVRPTEQPTAVQPTVVRATPTMASSTNRAPSDSVGQLDSSGLTRTYRLHVPSSYRAGQAVPLVVDLHGFGATAGEEELLSGFSKKADEVGFIAVYPQGLGQPPTWFDGPGPRAAQDQTFIRDLIHSLEDSYSVDPRRVYVTGISNGGGMVNYLGCDAADTFAAIAPVSGAYILSGNCHPSRPIPVLSFHGTADNIVPYGGKRPILPAIPDWAAAWATRDGCAPASHVSYRQGDVSAVTWDGCKSGVTVTLYTIAGGGHTWPGSGLAAPSSPDREINATDLIWNFFASYRLPQNN